MCFSSCIFEHSEKGIEFGAWGFEYSAQVEGIHRACDISTTCILPLLDSVSLFLKPNIYLFTQNRTALIEDSEGSIVCNNSRCMIRALLLPDVHH